MATVRLTGIVPPPRGRPGKRRWILLGTLAAVLVLPAALYLHYYLSAGRNLGQAIEEADRTDPRWRLEEIEADRAAIPEEENSATVVVAAARLLPASWGKPPVFESLASLRPNLQVDRLQAKALRAGLQGPAPALAEGRKLAAAPRGRFPITYTADYCATMLPHVQAAREVGYVLCCNAVLRKQDGDAEGAWTDGRAALNAGRAIGDESPAVSQLVRAAVRLLALRSMERTLAQGQVTEAALLETQRLLEEDAKEDLLLRAARGDRAGMHQLMVFLEASNGSVSRYVIGPTLTGGGQQPTLTQRAADVLPGNHRKLAHAWLLRHGTQVVEAVKLPPGQQSAALHALQKACPEAPGLVCGLAGDWEKLGKTFRDNRAVLRCGLAAIAAERYRLKNGRWPASLQALTDAGLLKAVPADPFSGAPLGLRKAADGIVIYSVGQDGSSTGDALDKKDLDPQAIRVEFRLWDGGRRRQAAAAVKAAPAP